MKNIFAPFTCGAIVKIDSNLKVCLRNLLFASAVVAFTSAACGAEPAEVTKAKAAEWKPVPTGAFADSINHAAMKCLNGESASIKGQLLDTTVLCKALSLIIT